MNSKLILKTEFKFFLELTEPEALALQAILCYDEKEFLEVFYGKMGKAYLQPHEDGFISLVNISRENLTPQLKDMDAIKKLIKEKTKCNK